MSRTSFRFDMMPWKLVFCEFDFVGCPTADPESPYSYIKIRELPEAPEPGRIPAGADHVHIVPKLSGERDAREEEKWRALMKSTARCSHGRIMSNPCSNCPSGRAADLEGLIIGHTMSGKDVAIPEYERLDDIKAWIRD